MLNVIVSGFKEIGYISAQTGVCAGLLADFRHANLPIFDKRSLQSMDCHEHRRVSVLLLETSPFLQSDVFFDAFVHYLSSKCLLLKFL